MKAMAGVLISLLLALAPSSVEAGECGGEGDSGSSDSGDSDSDDDEPACEEVSEVVGHSLCRRFGSWDASRRPAIRVSAGTSFHQLPVSSMSFSGVARHEDAPMSYRVAGDPGGDRASGGTVDLQLTAAIGRNLYAGIEGSAGALTTGRLASPISAESLAVEPQSLVYLSGAAVAGAAVSTGAFRFRGEVGVGVRAVGLTVETRHADCVASSTSYVSALLVRPRLAAERWITPWVSAGASVATNVFERGETSVGLFIGGHLRAFDAAR